MASTLRTEEGVDLLDASFLRRLRALSLASRRTPLGAAGGLRRAHGRGPGSEFADYREYSSGDDYRHVDGMLRTKRAVGSAATLPGGRLAWHCCSTAPLDGERRAARRSRRTLTAARYWGSRASMGHIPTGPRSPCGSFAPQRGRVLRRSPASARARGSGSTDRAPVASCARAAGAPARDPVFGL